MSTSTTNDTPLAVGNDMVISMDYVLRLDNGQVIDSSEGRGPFEFLHGHNQIIPGLEKGMVGMVVGEEREIVVAPEDAYGDIDPDAFQVVPMAAFPPDMQLEVGQPLQMSDRAGHIFNAVVVEVRPQGVLLNFNHPLAGETLHFWVRIAALRAATAEELEHGHIHEE